MLNAENIKDAEQRRLAWRCRRGMLELDILLERFLARYFERLSLDELRAFDAFLDLPDTEFWNILQMKNLHAKSLAQQSILDKLHALEGA
ncbi:MAG TPA: succinate dehydrogenase assembly factor 2 [Methylophilus sp.]|nr:succinate dehydrogenase assembly factor 2 [Methylophilus sp.]HQQ33429.1 succinate dehydrogenase assembly factor 2 [Methylophilus sp.]